jgi:hypothetical protein
VRGIYLAQQGLDDRHGVPRRPTGECHGRDRVRANPVTVPLNVHPQFGPLTRARVRAPIATARTSAPMTSGIRPVEGFAGPWNVTDCGDERQGANEYIDQEDPLPGRLHQQADERRSGRRGQGAGSSPDPYRPCAPPRGHGREQQAQAGGGECRRPHRPQSAESNQCPQSGTDRARGARQREHGQAGQEDLLAAVSIGQAAQWHQERRVHDGVDVQDPAQVRQGLRSRSRDRCRRRPH